MLEATFQRRLKDKIESRLGRDDTVVLKNDPNLIQGVPDLLILYKNKWAMLECKKSNKSKIQPNQIHYVSKFNSMSYANFIDPENQEVILDEMEHILKS